jgi:predicted DNA-binding transcriptional regulator AlpA
MIAAAKRKETEKEDLAAEDIAALEKAGVRVMLNQNQVLAIVPVAPVTLWRMEKKGQFPRGTFISPNKKIWYLDEIKKWQSEVEGSRRGLRHHPARIGSKPAKA